MERFLKYFPNNGFVTGLWLLSRMHGEGKWCCALLCGHVQIQSSYKKNRYFWKAFCL